MLIFYVNWHVSAKNHSLKSQNRSLKYHKNEFNLNFRSCCTRKASEQPRHSPPRWCPSSSCATSSWAVRATTTLACARSSQCSSWRAMWSASGSRALAKGKVQSFVTKSTLSFGLVFDSFFEAFLRFDFVHT